MSDELPAAEAVAASVCLLARENRWAPSEGRLSRAVAQVHGVSCVWCGVPLDDLAALVDAFNRCGEVAAFVSLSSPEKRRAVEQALHRPRGAPR